MTLLRLTGFAGENRALHPLLLNDKVGVKSINQKPGRGDLRPWLAPLAVAPAPTIVSSAISLLRMGQDVASDSDYWLSWQTVVHAVRGPNANDTAERTYFTGSGTPKWTNNDFGLRTPPFPTASRELGVPAPTSVPLVSAARPAPQAATALTVGSPYTITTVGTTNFMAIGATANTVGLVFTPTAAGSGTGTATSASTALESRYYTQTYVTDIGEESAPSLPSLELICHADDVVSISNLTAPPDGNYGITRRRIYRTQSGLSGDAQFYFQQEIGSTLTTATDNNTPLGEVLPSTFWVTPPVNLRFLTGLWNGMMAGISGRSVRFCEAYVPYAWPLAYDILPTADTPVALATYGQTLVVLTNGNPIMVTGGSPDAMDEQPSAFLQACVAPASAVSMGHGVAWASPDGLAYLGQGGARMLTDGILTRDDWQAMNPTSIMGCFYEQRYLGFYTVDGVKKGFVIDPVNPAGMYFMDFGVDGLYLDALQDTLYVLSGNTVKKWDAGAALTTTFRGSLNQLPRPMAALSVGQVVADSYPCSFTLFADGVQRHTQAVTNNSPFRLPGGYYAQTIQVEVSTAGAIQEVVVAHSMQEISQS